MGKRILAFIQGIGSVLELFPEPAEMPKRERLTQAEWNRRAWGRDARALRGDWLNAMALEERNGNDTNRLSKI